MKKGFSKDEYRRLFETVSDAIMIFDAKTGEFIDTNKATLTLYGYTRKEFLRLSQKEISAELEKSKHSINKTLKGRLKKIPLRYHKKKDGTIFPVEISASVLNLNGRQALCGVVRDISERKQAEEKLKQSEQKYRSVVDNIGIGVTLISPKMEILALNNQTKKWYPQIDVSKKPICYKAFNNPPREAICSYCPTYKTLRTGQIHESITDTPAGDKIINYRIISSAIKDKDGKVIAAIEMVEDITESRKKEAEKKELEERMRQADKLASIGQLAAGLAHEINNPLAIIKGNTQYIQKRLLKLLSKSKENSINEHREILERIVEETERCGKIMSGLLQFSKKDEGRTSALNINNQIVDVLAIVGHNLLLNKIKLIKSLSSDLPKIKGNANQLRQVFMNIILNAQDAMPKGGSLIVKTLYDKHNKNIEIKFRDTGRGIPKECLDKVFDPFFTTKGPGKGIGLGLPISYGIVSAHQGTIEIQSNPKGTTFVIKLSLRPKKH